MKIIKDIMDTAELYAPEELGSDKRIAYIELDYLSIQHLFKGNDFIKFIKKAEEKLSRKYNKTVVLKIDELPDTIPFSMIHSAHIGKTLQTTAMIKTITQFKPKLINILWYCKACGHTFRTLNEGETVTYPKVCPECSNKQFTIIYEDSIYEDYKLLKLEEPIESRTNKKFMEFRGKVEGYLASPYYDLQAGDVCNVIFTLKPVMTDKNALDTIMDVWNIKPLNQNRAEDEITEEEIEEMHKYFLDPNVLDKFVASYPLNIIGYENVKKGLILQQFSGTGIDENRGNIHCLLIGDPGIGKSLMLHATSMLTPKVISVNGAGTSLAGLTASAIRNDLTGSWELEAGAAVLADNGMLAIDEFDKLQKYVMLALNEPMEDRTITVSKANIQQTMSANINVLACANPKNSKFDTTKDIGVQMDIPSSLLSRFDLIYVLTDVINYDDDLSQAKQILSRDKGKDNDIFTVDFMKKYISYAKSNIFPVLTDEAIDYLAKFYAKTRGLALTNDESKPITKRELGVIYRLTIAHARMMLSEVANVDSAKVATEIYSNSINTLGLDYTTVGSIQNVLSKQESNIVYFIEGMLRNGESLADIKREVAEEWDIDNFNELYNIAHKNME